MQRLPNWQTRLGTTIAGAHQVTFAWGTWDCAQAIGQLIHAVTGENPAAAYRGKYSTEAEAIAILGSADNLGSFAASIAQQNGMEEVPPRFARRGDLVLVNNTPPATAANPTPTATTALGVVGLDPRFAHCAAEHGMYRVAMHRWLRAWRVG